MCDLLQLKNYPQNKTKGMSNIVVYESIKKP